MRISTSTSIVLSLLFGCRDKTQSNNASATDTQDVSCIIDEPETAPVYPTFNFSLATPAVLDLGTGSVRLSEGTQENLVFVQDNVIHQYASDGTLTAGAESSINIHALHTRSDGQITTCLLDDHRVLKGDGSPDTAPTLVGEMYNACGGWDDEEIPCWSYLNGCHIQEVSDGSVSLAVHHTYGMDDHALEDLYFTEDGQFVWLEVGDVNSLMGVGWGGGNNVLYKTGDTSVKIMSSTHQTSSISLDGTSISAVSTSPSRSALVTSDEAGVYVHDAAPCPVLIERIHTLAPMSRSRVTTYNGAIVVAGQDEPSGTFQIYGGSDILEYSYDTSLSQVSLVDVASSTGRIHLLYKHVPVMDGDAEYGIVTFDATEVTP